MSNTMLIGILKMPPELWRDDELDKVQRHSSYVRAAEMIEKYESEETKQEPDLLALWESAFEAFRAAVIEANVVGFVPNDGFRITRMYQDFGEILREVKSDKAGRA